MLWVAKGCGAETTFHPPSYVLGLWFTNSISEEIHRTKGTQTLSDVNLNFYMYMKVFIEKK